MRIVRVHLDDEPQAAVRAAERLAVELTGAQSQEVQVILGERAALGPAAGTEGGIAVSRLPRLRHLAHRLRCAAHEGALVHVHSLRALAHARDVPGHQLVVSPTAEGLSERMVPVLYGSRARAERELRRAAGVVCQTAGEADALMRRAGLDASRVHVLPASVDHDAIADVAPFTNLAPTIVALGPLQRHGRLERAVAALAVLPSELNLTVLGTGSGPTARAWTARLRRIARELGAQDRLTVEINPTADRRRRWLRSAHAVLIAAETGVHPWAVPEAVSAGAQVLVADVQAHRDAAGDELGRSVRLLPTSASPLAIADCVLSPRPAREESSPTGPATDTTGALIDLYAAVRAAPGEPPARRERAVAS